MDHLLALEDESVAHEARVLADEQAKQLLHSLDMLLYRCIDSLSPKQGQSRAGSAQTAAASPRSDSGDDSAPSETPQVVEKVDLDAGGRDRLLGFVYVQGSKITFGALELRLAKLPKPVVTGIGAGFPWVLAQMQNAHNFVLRACAVLNRWRHSFGKETADFLEGSCAVRAAHSACPGAASELLLCRRTLLEPATRRRSGSSWWSWTGRAPTFCSPGIKASPSRSLPPPCCSPCRLKR